MLKRSALIVMWLGLLMPPLAMSQNEKIGNDIEVQADEGETFGDKFDASEDDASLDMADSEAVVQDQTEEESKAGDASGTEAIAESQAADPVRETHPPPPLVNNTPPATPTLEPASCRCGKPGRLIGMRIQTGDRQCSSRQSGTVKWFNAEKCYGFITPENGQGLFVHDRSVQGNGFKCLKEGQQVTLKMVQGLNGLRADEVQAL